MKILAIRGKNLASLEDEFEINFEQEPLSSAGIFAITGPTGAGKSTLLDALCLALFDDVPRLNKAEQLKIEDENQDNITLKDSRNILRKGAADGYAEVDFKALNDDKYSARWMVRRARNKVDGALQNSTMQLINKTSGIEEQGGKTELKSKLIELIGLNFDQFTRAVLLAQGDFANFLKAKQSEKAELLEKLTGTDIYSKISIEIHEKANEAKNNLDILRNRIANIEILSTEELDALGNELNVFKAAITPLKLELEAVIQKQNWIVQEEKYVQNIQLAESKLKELRQLLELNKDRYTYLDRVEKSQEIRNVYHNLHSKNKYLESQQKELYNNQETLKTLEKSTLQAEQTLQETIVKLEELETKYLEAKPKIDKAKELDVEIKSANQRLNEVKLEHRKVEENIKKSDVNSKTLEDAKQQNEKTLATAKLWFEDNKQLAPVIDNMKVIFSKLLEHKNNQIQLQSIETSLASNKSLLASHQEELKKHEQEAEELNEVLPSEVIILRKKLQDNEPCPVCGSVEHPYIGVQHDDRYMQESELEKSKQRLAESIEKSKLKIETTEKLITQYETNHSNFHQMLKNNTEHLAELLQCWDDWQLQLEKGNLQANLQALEKKWLSYKQQLELATRNAENLNVKIEIENESKIKLQDDFQIKADLLQSLTSNLQRLEEDRNEIFGGKNIQMIEERYVSQKKEWSKSMDLAQKNKDENNNKKSKLEGTIQQLVQQIDDNKREIKQLSTDLDLWLTNNYYDIDIRLLQDIMLKDQDWINSEKKYLTDLKNNEISLLSTLEERKAVEKQHHLAPEKPSEEETKDVLLSKGKDLEEKRKEIDKGVVALEVKLKLHDEAVVKMKAIEKELQQKSELYNNWAKLNELLGSANGNKFKTIAQGYTLDVLLDYANKHLEDLNRRYKLEKIPNSLALQVIDKDMFGDVRPVHCLSGGESFLISLALALGLSSLSSNKIKIESLFIDEGFGSLDIDTLSVAMDALDNLQTQGRKIGVISHVEEMKERIPTQIQVSKSNHGGSSKIKVIGLNIA